MKLTAEEIEIMETLFDMRTGYVLDYSNSTFASAVFYATGVNIFDDKKYPGVSKANRLRHFLQIESPYKIGKLLDALLTHYQTLKAKENKHRNDEELVEKLRAAAQRLQDETYSVQLPYEGEEDFAVLSEDTDRALQNEQPELVLDRLHTYAVKYLRRVCEAHDIETQDEKGNYFPLQSLADKLKKYYEGIDVLQSGFALQAIKMSISLFESYNAVRNDQSYAHDNRVLQGNEAEYVVRIVSATLNLIEQTERFITEDKRSKQTVLEGLPNDIFEFELPF